MAMGGDFPSNFRELLKQIQRRLSLLERAMDTKARQGQVDVLDKYVDHLLEGGMPAGAIMSFGATGVDFDGAWLYCEGQEVSRSTYSRLFDAVGTTYGAGNGSTTFNLPNLKGRLPVGHSPGDPELGSVADTGGARTHTLTADEMPSHDHSASTDSAGSHNHSASTGSAGSHSHSASTGSAGSHSHTVGGLRRFMTTNRVTNFGHRSAPSGTSASAYVGAYAGDGTQSMGSESNTASTGSHSHSVSVSSGGSHSHSVTVNSGGAHSHSVSVQNAGGGEPHNNMPPYIVLPYIIKT